MISSARTRRQFLQSASAATLLSLHSPALFSSTNTLKETQFYTNLSCGRIGAKATFLESVELAVKYGFEAVDPDAKYFAQLSDSELANLLEDLKAKNLKFGSGSLPVDFRKDETTFGDGLKRLPEFCRALQRARIWRVSTYFLSFSDEFTYLQNFRTHSYRLRACAQILKDHGQKLGLEYLGPMTLWRSRKHPFLHTMSETKELLVAIGTGNVGFHLDCWHWYTAGETEADLLTVRNEEITAVDLNDAPAGLTLDKQIDASRELPAATGVIPVKTFLDALRKIGYDGPIHAEPFNAALRALPREEAVAKTAAAMKKAFSL
jgi:sugar phosphate isomerase/epimerase